MWSAGAKDMLAKRKMLAASSAEDARAYLAGQRGGAPADAVTPWFVFPAGPPLAFRRGAC